jgi:hypothetical protein
MTGAAAGGAAAAAAAAAQRRRMQQEEEEKMTGYHKEDLEGWEFKIVRANTRKFKNSDTLRKVCEEEAQAGWEMIEKFDDSRIRFKRRVDNRARDAHLQIDPYRSLIGMGEGGVVALVLGIMAVVALVVLLIVKL